MFFSEIWSFQGKSTTLSLHSGVRSNIPASFVLAERYIGADLWYTEENKKQSKKLLLKREKA